MKHYIVTLLVGQVEANGIDSRSRNPVCKFVKRGLSHEEIHCVKRLNEFNAPGMPQVEQGECSALGARARNMALIAPHVVCVKRVELHNRHIGVRHRISCREAEISTVPAVLGQFQPRPIIFSQDKMSRAVELMSRAEIHFRGEKKAGVSGRCGHKRLPTTSLIWDKASQGRLSARPFARRTTKRPVLGATSSGVALVIACTPLCSTAHREMRGAVHRDRAVLCNGLSRPRSILRGPDRIVRSGYDRRGMPCSNTLPRGESSAASGATALLSGMSARQRRTEGAAVSLRALCPPPNGV